MGLTLLLSRTLFRLLNKCNKLGSPFKKVQLTPTEASTVVTGIESMDQQSSRNKLDSPRPRTTVPNGPMEPQL
jgi:hypothetical protein